jgi:hypothetical protein
MSNTRRTRPPLTPQGRKSQIHDPYERKRPVYRRDLRAVREKMLANPKVEEWLNREG